VFSTAQAQDGAQDATFKTVRCEKVIVGDSKNHQAVVIRVGSLDDSGSVYTFNKAGKIVTILSTTDNGHGMISTRSNTGKILTYLSASDTGIDADAHGIISTGSNTGKKLVSIGSSDSGGSIAVNNIHGVKVVDIQADKNKDGVIGLFDRYGDVGWIRTGKQ